MHLQLRTYLQLQRACMKWSLLRPFRPSATRVARVVQLHVRPSQVPLQQHILAVSMLASSWAWHS